LNHLQNAPTPFAIRSDTPTAREKDKCEIEMGQNRPLWAAQHSKRQTRVPESGHERVPMEHAQTQSGGHVSDRIGLETRGDCGMNPVTLYLIHLGRLGDPFCHA